MSCSPVSASHEDMGCTSRTCFSACREGRGCTQRTCFLSSRADRGCTLRSCLSACREGRGCTSRTCFSACRGGRGCTPRSWLSACREGRGCTAHSAFLPPVRASFLSHSSRTRFCGHRKRRGRSRGFFFVLSQYRIIGSAKIQLAVLWPPIVVQHPSPHNSSRVHAEKAHLWRFKRTPYGRLQRLRGRGANQLVHDARVKEERLDTSTFGQSSVPTPADVGTDARSTV